MNEIRGVRKKNVMKIIQSLVKQGGCTKNELVFYTGLSLSTIDSLLEEMLKNGYNLGGEQSGHIIYLDYNPTGDGILTSLMLVKILLERNQKPSEASKIVKIYPQVLINAKVNSDKKYDFDKDEEIKEAIEKVSEEFSGNGRVLIRPSGTEPLVRVMIEGEDQEVITKKAREIADLIEKKLK